MELKINMPCLQTLFLKTGQILSEEDLLFTSLAEMATKRIAEKTQAFGFAQNRVAAEKGGKVAKNARIDFKEETGVKVVSPISSKDQSITNERLMG